MDVLEISEELIGTEKSENSEENQHDSENKETKKYYYEYFKQLATFSISLIAIYGGIARVLRPEGDFSSDFMYGMLILFITVFYSVLGMIIVIFKDDPEKPSNLMGSIWLTSTVGFFLGLMFLIIDFKEDYDLWIPTLLILISGIVVLGFFTILSVFEMIWERWKTRKKKTPEENEEKS